MDAPALVALLRRTPAALDALLAGLPDACWRLRPAGGGWSILEVVNHLADEDPLDFRARLASLLEDPERDWPPIDPQGDVTRKAFQQRDPAESLARFRVEREASLAWLASVAGADWSRAKSHPKAGPIHAGDLLAAWAAHDARHLTQIAKLLHGVAAHLGAPYSVAYAG